MPGGQEAIPQQAFTVDHAQQQASGPTTGHPKRRQYAAGQTQAYQGTAETVPQYADHTGPMQPAGGQLFTPGISNEGGFNQQQQAPYFAPAEAQYGQPAAAMPPYQQQAAPMAQLGDQFGQMNLTGGGQKPVSDFLP
jgi:protein transport protein SEC24